MNLQTKLFLWIGMLLLFVGVSMFFISRYFIERDLSAASEKVQELIDADYATISKTQQDALTAEIDHFNGNISSLLFFVYGSENIPKTFNFTPGGQKELWSLAASLIAYNPDMGMLELGDKASSKAVTILSANANLYPARYQTTYGDFAWIALDSSSQTQSRKETAYLGLRIKHPSEHGNFSYYALFDVDSSSEEIKKMQALVGEAAAEKEKPYLETLQEYSFEGPLKRDANWAEQTVMIQVLAPLYGEGIKFDSGSQKIPVGIVRLDSAGIGSGILSKDVFRDKPLFDASAYYESHRPKEGASPIASGHVILYDNQSGYEFLANTLSLENAYVTIGAAVKVFGEDMATTVARPVLMAFGNKKWVGFDAKGNPLSKEALVPLQNINFLEGARGQIVVGDQSYTYFKVVSPKMEELAFYILIPEERQFAIVNTLEKVGRTLPNKISFQLFIAFLISLGLSLLITSRLAGTLTKPIKKLAAATNSIVKGNYTNIELPKMNGRKDEIATLTNAFGDMVAGLQEKEKIRGVLNKVVSKEVAEQIMTGGIQLGGEDRVVTMLFADIRGFTELSSHLSPQKTIAMLNECMTLMCEVIEGEGGIIDKFVGDEIMALYGAPTFHPDQAIRALASAKFMIERLKKWNKERQARGEHVIEMGIGIHTGPVVAGNMGAIDRVNYTVIGANVNLAARLCQKAGPLQILISQETLDQPHVKERYEVNQMDRILLKGFDNPVQIYEVVGFKWDID